MHNANPLQEADANLSSYLKDAKQAKHNREHRQQCDEHDDLSNSLLHRNIFRWLVQGASRDPSKAFRTGISIIVDLGPAVRAKSSGVCIMSEAAEIVQAGAFVASGHAMTIAQSHS